MVSGRIIVLIIVFIGFGLSVSCQKESDGRDSMAILLGLFAISDQAKPVIPPGRICVIDKKKIGNCFIE